MIRTFLTALAAAVAAFFAVRYSQQASDRKAQAKRERQLAATVSHETHAARKATERAAALEKEADEIAEKARWRVEKVARSDQTLEELVSRWNSGN